MKPLLVVIILCTTTIAAQGQTSQFDSTKINIDNSFFNMSDYAQYSFKVSKPLFILEGKVLSIDSLDQINPETIESIEVLKGKETEAYGEKGKNGVFIIKLRQIRKPE